MCTEIPISTKFGKQVALPKPYISIKFGMIHSKTDENMNDNQIFYQFLDMPTGKIVGVIILKFVDCFDGFVIWSTNAD